MAEALTECCDLLLQRRLVGDGHRWRTVLRLAPQRVKQAVAWADDAAAIDPLVEWRIVRADRRGPEGR